MKNLKLYESNKNGILKKYTSTSYFKTDKEICDRYIQIPKNSIINFLFPSIKGFISNLDIIKVVDNNNKIKELVGSNRFIEKGEILSLDTHLIMLS